MKFEMLRTKLVGEAKRDLPKLMSGGQPALSAASGFGPLLP